MSNVVELRNELEAKNRELAAIFEQAGTELDLSKVDALKGFATGADKAAEVKRRNDELTDIGKRLDEALETERAAEHVKKLGTYLNEPVNKPAQPSGKQAEEPKSLGKLIMEQKGKLTPGGAPITIPFEAKTLFETTAGWAPESMRIDRVELAPARPIAVVDFIPQFPTTQAAIKYMRETTANFNALEKAEAAAYAESQFVLTEQTQTVEKITSSIPVTDEQLDDVPAAEEYLNSRLTYDIRRRLDLQVLEGTGATPLLLGTLNIGGSLQTQALGSDPVPDAIYKAFDKIRTVGFTEPSVLFCHPNDWQPVRLLRTADGVYIWGNPQDAGPERIWGKRILQTTAVTTNTMICGDYAQFSALYVRSGLEVSMGYVNDDFTKGKKTIRAQMRCAMVHFRTSAFATITGV